MNDVDELLRRDGERWRVAASDTPQVDWTRVSGQRRSRTSSWWMAGGVAVTAAAVAALAVVVPSALNGRSTAPSPAHRPGPSPKTHPLGGPASFIGITSQGVSQADARTGESRGMAVSEEGRRVTALGATDDGNVAYATYSHPRCQVGVHRYRWTSPTTSEGTDAATIAGIKGDDVAVSPDGHLIAVSVQPCNRPRESVDDLVVVNLDTHQQWRWTGYSDMSRVSQLQWGPDNRTLAYVVAPCCGGGSEGPRLLDTAAPGRSYVKPDPLPVYEGIGNGVFWFRGKLAVLSSGGINAVAADHSIGPILVDGLPGDLVSVRPDRSGSHLLLTTQGGQLLRWDDGVLTPLRGHWVDAGW